MERKILADFQAYISVSLIQDTVINVITKMIIYDLHVRQTVLPDTWNTVNGSNFKGFLRTNLWASKPSYGK